MTQTLPITLGVLRPDAQFLSKKKNDGPKPIFGAMPQEARLRVLERDNYTCACCGFRSERYQDILFMDGNPENHADNNVKTVCIFCHQCFHMDGIGAMRSGVLIWMPEISQTDLHHIARAIYVARITQGPMADAARSSLDKIMARREAAKERILTDDPAVLASVLKEYLEPKQYQRRGEKLDGIRLFPLDRRIIKEGGIEFNQFPQILAFWRSKAGPYGEMLPTNWLDYYRDTLGKAA